MAVGTKTLKHMILKVQKLREYLKLPRNQLTELIKKKNPLIHYGDTIDQWPKGQASPFIWSMTNFEHILNWWAKHIITPNSIVEIGIEHGIGTQALQELAKRNKANHIAIDPSITNELAAVLKSNYKHTTIIIDKSLTALKKLKQKGRLALTNWFVIDGDHNYYTFYNELKLIVEDILVHPRPFVIFAHDLGWPNATRDSYYNISDIPQKYRQPLQENGGFVRLHHSQLQPIGSLYSEPLHVHTKEGKPMYANTEGTSKNGLLPAFRDIEHKFSDLDLILTIVPANWGLGIITSLRLLPINAAPKLLFFLRALALFFPLLSTLEYTRLSLLEEYNRQSLRIQQLEHERQPNAH